MIKIGDSLLFHQSLNARVSSSQFSSLFWSFAVYKSFEGPVQALNLCIDNNQGSVAHTNETSGGTLQVHI